MKRLIIGLTVAILLLVPLTLSGGCQQGGATLEYRDHLEMGVGGCGGNIFFLSKGDSWLENRLVSYTLGVREDGEFKPLTEPFEVVDNCDFSNLGDDEMVYFQGTIMRVEAASAIQPGEYELTVRLEVEGKGGIDYLPLTIEVAGAADDILFTPGGAAYRANVHGPDTEEWPPVAEQTVSLGDQEIQLDYRDYVELGVGDCKGILFTLHTAGTGLEGKDVSYTVGLLNGDTITSLPEPLAIAEMWSYDDPPHQSSPLTVMMLEVDCRMDHAEEFELGVQLEAEGIGVIGCVPLTVSVVEAADDILFTPGGAAYRASVHGLDTKEWPPVAETTVYLEAS